MSNQNTSELLKEILNELKVIKGLMSGKGDKIFVIGFVARSKASTGDTIIYCYDAYTQLKYKTLTIYIKANQKEAPINERREIALAIQELGGIKFKDIPEMQSAPRLDNRSNPPHGIARLKKRSRDSRQLLHQGNRGRGGANL